MEKELSQTPSAIKSRKWRRENIGYAAQWIDANKEKHRARGKEYTRPGTLGWATKKLRALWLLSEKEGYKPPDITRDRLVGLYGLHGHTCDICGRSETDNGKGLGLDHDHITGKVRGFICIGCNQVLGIVKDNISTLQKMINYLKGI